jgi:hypothetical protein
VTEQPKSSRLEVANELDLVRRAVFSRTPEETVEALNTQELIRAKHPVEESFLLFTNEVGLKFVNNLTSNTLHYTYYLLTNLMPKLTTNDLQYILTNPCLKGLIITNEQTKKLEINTDEDRIELIIACPKEHFNRWRPYQYDARLLYGKMEANPGYPSGHATRGWLYALLLERLFPEKREAILEKGREIGWDRVRLGMHFPSDVWAGQVLGQAIWQELMANPTFMKDLTNAVNQIRAWETNISREASPH